MPIQFQSYTDTDRLRDRAERFVRTFAPFEGTDEAFRYAHGSQLVHMRSVLNQTEFVQRQVRDVMADPGFPTLAGALRADVALIAEILDGTVTDLRDASDPDLVWQHDLTIEKKVELTNPLPVPDEFVDHITKRMRGELRATPAVASSRDHGRPPAAADVEVTP